MTIPPELRTLRRDADKLEQELIGLRRELHAAAESGLELPRTQGLILGALGGLPLDIRRGDRLSSVAAVLRGRRRNGPVVLLRSDMDALNIHEETGLDIAAPNNAMHACGHDLHMAMLVGAARLLNDRRAHLDGDVVFMFQPGEEGWDGARLMIEEGVLDAAGRRANFSFAIHVLSATVPHGVFASRPGQLLAASDQLAIKVTGRGGHASAPHLALDPVPVAAELLLALDSVAKRRFDPFDPVVLAFGSVHAGAQGNVTPEHAELEGVVRTFSDSTRRRVSEVVARLVEGIADANGMKAEVELRPRYPLTVNDAAQVSAFAALASTLLGPQGYVEMARPMTASEDFSLVLQEVPGLMTMLGACPPGADPSSKEFNHSPRAMFDEGVISTGAEMYAAYALDRLRVSEDSR